MGKRKAGRKPSGRSKSLKRPDIYDDLRQERGMSKTKAAKISNAIAGRAKRHGRKRRAG